MLNMVPKSYEISKQMNSVFKKIDVAQLKFNRFYLKILLLVVFKYK